MVYYFEIPRAPSEILANQPGQLGLSGQIFLHWAAATLKGLVEFQNNFSHQFSPSYLSQKWSFQDFSPLILAVLSGVIPFMGQHCLKTVSFDYIQTI